MKEISFYPSSKEAESFVPPPKPARNYLQHWYKNTKFFTEGKEPKFEDNLPTNLTVKACVPFYDAMTAGYIQETWCDIHINKTDQGLIQYNFSSMPRIMTHRGDVNFPENDVYHNAELVWYMPWVPKVPEGYSVLSVSPQNFILPFKTLSAIMDSDVFYHTLGGRVPFYVKKEFSGIIPAGTPMYQFIMIKRDEWKSNIEKWDDEKSRFLNDTRNKKPINAYRYDFHIKKKYK